MLNPYLRFAGQGKAALELYTRAFGIKMPEHQLYGDMPGYDAARAGGAADWVLHAELEICGGTLMISDADNPMGDNVNVCVSVSTDSETAQKAWDVLKNDNGVPEMELAPTFFAKLHGTIRDKFGIIWMFTVSA